MRRRPRCARRLATTGPTPWRLSTGRSSASGRGPLRDQRSGGSRPAKPRKFGIPANYRTRLGGLRCFLHLAALEAAGADIGALRRAVQEDADALQVRVEAPPRGHHGVAPAVA